MGVAPFLSRKWSRDSDMFVLTFDLDWAPDFVIDWLAGYLVERALPATWFVTHMSAAVRRLAEHPTLFELGIHPNFIQPSTHGRTVAEIIEHCLELVPRALSMRTHSLYQSTPLLVEVLERTEVRVDASIFLPVSSVIEPVEFTWEGRTMLRVPFFWEDDLAMRAGQTDWDIAAIRLPKGPKVVDFHPLHLFLNSSSMAAYEALKRRVPRLHRATPRDIEPLVNQGDGVMTLFSGLSDAIDGAGTGHTLRELYARWHDDYRADGR